jgi:hypothetical protein
MKRSDTLAKRTADSLQKRPTSISPADLLCRTANTAPTRYRFRVDDPVGSILLH